MILSLNLEAATFLAETTLPVINSEHRFRSAHISCAA